MWKPGRHCPITLNARYLYEKFKLLNFVFKVCCTMNIGKFKYLENSVTSSHIKIIGISWRNGNAPDSRSGGCVFKSRRDQNFELFMELLQNNCIGSTRISNEPQVLYCLVVRITQDLTQESRVQFPLWEKIRRKQNDEPSFWKNV